MARIFLSYAHEDQPAAKRIVDALAREGLDAWWDHEIPPGRSWDEVIGQRIGAATVVIVIWSARSVGSNFVKEEAQLALDARKLLPVKIEEVEPPVGFRRVHAANLAGWRGESAHRQWQAALGEIRSRLGVAPAAPASSSSTPAPAPNPSVRNGVIIGVAVAAAIAIAAFMFTRQTAPEFTQGVDAPAVALDAGLTPDGAVETTAPAPEPEAPAAEPAAPPRDAESVAPSPSSGAPSAAQLVGTWTEVRDMGGACSTHYRFFENTDGLNWEGRDDAAWFAIHAGRTTADRDRLVFVGDGRGFRLRRDLLYATDGFGEETCIFARD